MLIILHLHLSVEVWVDSHDPYRPLRRRAARVPHYVVLDPVELHLAAVHLFFNQVKSIFEVWVEACGIDMGQHSLGLGV